MGWGDSQLYLLMCSQPNVNLANPFDPAKKLKAVVGWLRQSRLQLNPIRTKVLWLYGGVRNLGDQLLALVGVPLKLAETINNLSVLLDPSLTTEVQIENVSKHSYPYAKSSN